MIGTSPLKAADIFPPRSADKSILRGTEIPDTSNQATNWEGPYIGNYIGGAFGAVKGTDLEYPDVIVSNHFKGFTTGIFGGYNQKIGAVIVGGEAEFGFSGSSGGKDYYNSESVNDNFGKLHWSDKQTAVGRLRARLGYAFDDILIFAAAGMTLADHTTSKSLTGSDLGNTSSFTKILTGYNIGVGGEYNFAKNWIVRSEYIYDNFGTRNYMFTRTDAQLDDHKIKTTTHTARAAIAYKF